MPALQGAEPQRLPAFSRRPAPCLPQTRSPPNLSLNWFDNDEELAGGDTILTAGYNQVTNYLQSQLTSRGGRVVLNAPVTAVATSANSVTVRVRGGMAP